MNQPLEISFNDVEASPQLETLIHERVERLEAICDQLISCHVDVAQADADQEGGSGYRIRIALRVQQDGSSVAYSHSSQGSTHDTVMTVVRCAFEEIERQLKERPRI